MVAIDYYMLREGIIALSRQASAAIMQVYGGEFAVQRKDDDSPLTAADLASHRCIVDGLEKLSPGITILSEESEEEVPALLRRQWARLWQGDTLAGNQELAKRHGELTVTIDLIEDRKSDGKGKRGSVCGDIGG